MFMRAPESFQDTAIGEVRHIRGRNAAKEACAKGTLQFLVRHIHKSRARAEHDMEAEQAARKMEEASNDDVPASDVLHYSLLDI
jgi:hypothetical protein